MEFIAAKCPNCGGELRLPDDKKQVRCMYCGFDVIVRDAVREAGANVENLLKLASTAESTGNYEEAYKYFTQILEFEPDNYIALFGKGITAGRLSNSNNLRIDELTKGIESAIKHSSVDKGKELKNQAAELIYEICANHEVSMIQEPLLINCLEIAHNYNPENVKVISLIISKSHRKILVAQQVIDIKQAQRNLEQDKESLNREIKELEHYSDLKNNYFAKLQSVAPEIALSLSKTLKQSEEENNEKIESLRKIRPIHTNTSGCLVAVINQFILTLIIIIFLSV